MKRVMPVNMSDNGIIFAESPEFPGVPVVYRSPEERNSNPERMNLGTGTGTVAGRCGRAVGLLVDGRSVGWAILASSVTAERSRC